MIRGAEPTAGIGSSISDINSKERGIVVISVTLTQFYSLCNFYAWANKGAMGCFRNKERRGGGGQKLKKLGDVIYE